MPSSDVFIWGGTMPGIIAAKLLADAGKTVVIVEERNAMGGMQYGGLVGVDHSNGTAFGHTRLFFEEVAQAALASGMAPGDLTYHPNGLIRNVLPSWVKTVIDSWLSHPNITVHKNVELLNVSKDHVDKLLTSVAIDVGGSYTAANFIDASYEGALLIMAGVSTIYGRDSIGHYGEPYAGVSVATIPAEKNVSYRVTTERGDLWRRYTFPPSLPDGMADYSTQGYDFRMVYSTMDDRLPFADLNIPNYNPAEADDIVREFNRRGASSINFIASYSSQIVKRDPADPTAKFIAGTNGFDWVGKPSEYPRLRTKAQRQRFDADLWRSHAIAFKAAATDMRVPSALRTDMQRWGLPGTEYQEQYTITPGWASYPYIRNCTRMRGGENLMTVRDMQVPNRYTRDDPIHIQYYSLDSHDHYWYDKPGGGSAREGVPPGGPGSEISNGVGPGQVSYRTLFPNPGQARNLIGVWVTQESYLTSLSSRMEPTKMLTGEAGGHTAIVATERGIPMSQVPYDAVRQRLDAVGGIYQL